MSVGYHPVQWNRNKYIYDIILLIGVIGYIFVFKQLAPLWIEVDRMTNPSIIGMRAYGSCAFLMLTIILCIGPLTRLDARFLPLLYNRRHFGVMLFVIALIHVEYVLGWYHAFSPINPLISIMSSNTNYTSVSGFPFEILGLFALLILFVMAATSHDFWFSFLTPAVWKGIHMSIYVVYALIVMHVILGMVQAESLPVYTILVVMSLVVVSSLHLTAGFKEWRRERYAESRTSEQGNKQRAWVRAAHLTDIPPNKGVVVPLVDGERVAIFRYDNKLSAVSNVCAHQNGPIGEGAIIDGCIVCPWHGFQYRPEDGCALPPFTEKIPTYRLRLEDNQILLDPRPLPPGTYVDPITIEEVS